MNPEQALREEHSKQRTRELVEWIGNDAGCFGKMVGFMTGGDPLVNFVDAGVRRTSGQGQNGKNSCDAGHDVPLSGRR